MDNALLDLRYSNNVEVIKFYDLNKKKQANVSDIVTKTINIASEACNVEAIKEASQKKVDYVVNLSDKAKKAIEKGELILDTDKKGNIYAQYRNHGKFGDKISISEKITKEGLDPLEVSQALQQKAIEKQLKKISGAIDNVNYNVLEVIQGQQSDRLALFYSGIELYLEAQSTNDDTLKKMVTAQALKSISDGTSQIIETTKDKITYMVEGKYKDEIRIAKKEDKKTRGKDIIDSHMDILNGYVQTINYAYLVKAYIYYENNELGPMLLALEEYSKFLSNEIVPYVDNLIELDRSDISLTNGKWETRAKQLASLNKVRQQICDSSEFYIPLSGGKEK